MGLARVMIVEDESVVALHIQRQLLRLGYDVASIASTGPQALQEIASYPPDIVLMDIHLIGEMDGIETASLIPQDHLIPVVYLTAYSDDGMLARASLTKPAGYLLKPFTPRELHATLLMALERRRSELALRESESKLRQSRKLEIIGKLTGGMAHDFNNVLGIMMGNLELVEERTNEDPLTHEMIGAALDAGRRGAGLIHDLLAYARQQTLQPKRVSVACLILSLAKLVRRTFGEAIEIETAISGSLWTTLVDANQFESALLNLAVNARDAMPAGGKLTISATNIVLDKRYADQHSDVTPGPYLRIDVCDTGMGMSKEVIEQSVEPFFTTKPVGEGTGLGLSMVYGFVAQSGGHLDIDSAIGSGTKIRLYLPKAPSLPSVVTEVRQSETPLIPPHIITAALESFAAKPLGRRLL